MSADVSSSKLTARQGKLLDSIAQLKTPVQAAREAPHPARSVVARGEVAVKESKKSKKPSKTAAKPARKSKKKCRRMSVNSKLAAPTKSKKIRS
jgi:hypothetical protein